ncbi:uncharacterized protein LOC134265847 [Saccostrea cucullata]|uniref:uncharacterized protein LOC134265847 n=1 Tax=Saccostrea cuccullata TaxID=36930 RepID=UPI002ED0EAEB
MNVNIQMLERGCEARTCTYEEYNKCGWLYPFPVWDADPEVCNYTLSQINCVEKVNYACKSNPYGYSYSSFWGTKKYGSKVVLARGIETSITYQEQFKMWGCVAPTCSYSEIDKCTQLERDLPVRTSSEKRCKQLLSGQSCLHKINEDCKSSPYATSTLRTKGNETLELIGRKSTTGDV